MTTQNFETIAKKQFGFLESHYGFKLVKCEKKECGYELLYLTDLVGIKIVYEFSQAYIFITLYKLKNGKFVENPTNITLSAKLYGYSLDDIIHIRNSSALVKPAYQYGIGSEFYDEQNGLNLYVGLFAQNLEKYAKDILTARFDIFKEVDKAVKERIEKHD